MSRIDVSTQELFLKLGSTPAMRSARADKLFRRLREDDADAIKQALLSAPSKLALSATAKTAKKKTEKEPDKKPEKKPGK